MPAATAPISDDAPHFLVVDDDRRIRDLLSRYLRREGYRITTARNAADARAKLDGLAFDLLILDVMMPGESGFELAKALRLGPRHLRKSDGGKPDRDAGQPCQNDTLVDSHVLSPWS